MKKISFSIPIEVKIEFSSLGNDKKNKKAIKNISKWLSNDLKNIYIPVVPCEHPAPWEDPDAVAIVKKIRIGKAI